MNSKSKLQDAISGMLATGKINSPKMPKLKTKVKFKSKKKLTY